jgi:hypothetical protein
VLEKPVAFSLPPQALRDALAFLAERFQIPILIDPSVTATTDVSAPGEIRLRSVLTILLEQCPQRLVFKIKGNVLKIELEGAAP